MSASSVRNFHGAVIALIALSTFVLQQTGVVHGRQSAMVIAAAIFLSRLLWLFWARYRTRALLSAVADRIAARASDRSLPRARVVAPAEDDEDTIGRRSVREVE